MGQVTIYLEDEIEQKMVASAKATKQSKSKWIANVIREKLTDEWPATVRATLERRGKPIGPYDTLTAGTALAYGATLVSRNTQEFRRVKTLRPAQSTISYWVAPSFISVSSIAPTQPGR